MSDETPTVYKNPIYHTPEELNTNEVEDQSTAEEKKLGENEVGIALHHVDVVYKDEEEMRADKTNNTVDIVVEQPSEEEE